MKNVFASGCLTLCVLLLPLGAAQAASTDASGISFSELGSQIKQDAKQAGSEVATGAKHVGHAIKSGASSFGHSVVKGGKEVGHLAKQGAHSVGSSVQGGLKAAKKAVTPEQSPPAPIEQGSQQQ
jgi:hypothetical protein